MKIYLDDPNINTKDILEVHDAIACGHISTVGPQVKQFEDVITDYLGGNVYCVATNSGSAALFVSLKVLGIGPGDEVIIPATTFIATANAVAMTGAKPVIVDINANTWNIDPVEIEKAITPRTKAILPVHLYGNSCDMKAIEAIAVEYDLYIIEDACESLGATYSGLHTGTIGHIGCVSFNRNKVITTGGGGMVVMKDKELAEKIKQFVNQGRDEVGSVRLSGFNFGMTNQNAALGLSQFNRLYEFIVHKDKLNNLYYAYLDKLIIDDTIQMQFYHANAKHSFWFTAIKIDTQKVGKYISEIMIELQEKGIPTRRIFEPITNFKPYGKIEHKLTNAYDLFENGLCLPSSTLNTYEGIEYVCKTLLEVLQ